MTAGSHQTKESVASNNMTANAEAGSSNVGHGDTSGDRSAQLVPRASRSPRKQSRQYQPRSSKSKNAHSKLNGEDNLDGLNSNSNNFNRIEGVSGSSSKSGERIIATKRLGTVKFFNPQKGYGFIIPDDPYEHNGVNGRNEIFVHHTAIFRDDGGFKSLGEGERVEYDLVEGIKGIQASNVCGPGGKSVTGESVTSVNNYSRANYGVYPPYPVFLYIPGQQAPVMSAGAALVGSPPQPYVIPGPGQYPVPYMNYQQRFFAPIPVSESGDTSVLSPSEVEETSTAEHEEQEDDEAEVLIQGVESVKI